MLAVITDDLTGASEIAGIALARGSRTVIASRDFDLPDCDVLVVSSNMRSMLPEAASLTSAELTRQIVALSPLLIFKKTDSVLRGNVGPELKAQMHVEGKDRALLVPANPSRNRVVKDGIYYVDGVPVAESDFGFSQGISLASSGVTRILETRGLPGVISVSPDEPMELPGVYAGNAESDEDLRRWAERVDESVVPAGAADFFSALLDSMASLTLSSCDEQHLESDCRALYLCGSNFPQSRQAVHDAVLSGIPVISMPDAVYFSDAPDPGRVSAWASDVVRALKQHNRVIVNAKQQPKPNCLCSSDISAAMAVVVARAVEENAVDELFVEGGATAEAVMSALQVERLYPCDAIVPGVTRMRVHGYPTLHVTMKPGSYRWPSQIWNFNQAK